MRKALCCVLLFCLLCVGALAEEAWFQQQEEELIPAGIAASAERTSFSLPLPDGREAVSLCLTVSGDIHFGRYAQVVRTALLDAESGEALGLDAVFTDLDELQIFLDDYVDENVLEELNSYLDAGELLPVPLDAVSFDAVGVTFHYPSERFMFFSGHAGAVALRWYELADLLAIDQPSQADVELPMQIDAAIAQYGTLYEPDLVDTGALYEFEAPILRGVQAIVDETGHIVTIREARFEEAGIHPGMTREEVDAVWGESGSVTLQIDAALAQRMRVRPGVCVRYDTGTSLYFDEDGIVYLRERDHSALWRATE